MKKITIASIYDKNEDFIELQYNSIKRFIEGDVEYIVFNNSSDAERRNKITHICSSLGIKSFELTINHFLPPSHIHACAMNQMWQSYLSKLDGLLMCMDSDMFFISELDIEEIGNNYDVGYIPQYRNNFSSVYMWAGMFFLNLDTIDKNIDFSICNIGEMTDSGGATYYFLKEKDYRKLYFRFCHIKDIEEDTLITDLNGVTGFVRFTNDIPEREYCTKKFFPHEKENLNYMEDFGNEYLEHKQLIEKYSFPRPYSFDLLKIENQKKSFMFHYKSANWEELYGDGKNSYSIMKKESLRKMLLDL
jgi:hypothetical protein